MTTTMVEAPTTPRARAAGTATLVTGLAFLAAAPLTLFVVGMLAGVPIGEGLVFLVVGAVLAAGAVAARRSGTWAAVTGLVLTVLAVVAGFWVAFGLLAPASPGDFVPATMFVVGVVLALTGGVRAIASRRRPPPAPGASGGERRTRAVALGLVVVAAIVSVGLNLAGRTSVDPAVAEGATPVTMAGFAFADREVVVAAGADAQLLVRNRDAFLHDLALPTYGLEVVVQPGSEALLDVSGLAPGTYVFYCTLHSDVDEPDPEAAGMAGTLVVG